MQRRTRWADFVMVRKDLADHPNVVALAMRIGAARNPTDGLLTVDSRSPDGALTACARVRRDCTTISGAIVSLWSHADKRCDENDVVTGITPAWVDYLTGVDGLGAALEPCAGDWFRWVDGGLQFVEYQRLNGPAARARALAAMRQQRYDATRTDGKRSTDGRLTVDSRSTDGRMTATVGPTLPNIEKPPNPLCGAKGEPETLRDGHASGKPTRRGRKQVEREREAAVLRELERVRRDPANARLLKVAK